MTYRGRVKNGTVVLDKLMDLPDGAEVEVTPVEPQPAQPEEEAKLPTLAERLAPFIGKLKGLPPDLSANLDHYLYGTPKKR